MDYPIPIPILGWNARDSFESMKPQYAISLNNALPDETTIVSRKGYTEFTTELGASVETLATYKGNSGTGDLLACYGGKIAVINTTTGAATVKQTHGNNDRFKTLNINNLLVMVNGESTPVIWNGTSIANLTITGHSTPEDLDGVMSFKSRAYYWTENENSFWYASAGAHTGALTEFGVDYVSSQGGGITELVTWTRDSGDGMDDLFVVLMNTGEVLVYQGDDPASNFSLIGKFTLGQPISNRGSCNLASDRIIITRDGYVNLSTALQQARLTVKNNVGENIVNAAKRELKKHSELFGWDVQFLPSQSLLIVNIPQSTDTFIQHVMNTNSGAWCRFNNMNAVSWIEHENQPYFGTSDGKIMKAFEGTHDAGSAITSKIIPAFNPLGNPTREKTLTVCSLITNHSYPDYISVDAYRDFNITGSENLGLPPENDGEYWGDPDWDEAYWGGDGDEEFEGVKCHKYPIAQYGTFLTVKVRHQSKTQQVKYYSFKLKYKGGKA